MRILLSNLFLVIKVKDIRLQIFNRFYLIETIIRLIYTFLKNTKYFKSYSRILKKLLLNKYKDSFS